MSLPCPCEQLGAWFPSSPRGHWKLLGTRVGPGRGHCSLGGQTHAFSLGHVQPCRLQLPTLLSQRPETGSEKGGGGAVDTESSQMRTSKLQERRGHERQIGSMKHWMSWMVGLFTDNLFAESAPHLFTHSRPSRPHALLGHPGSSGPRPRKPSGRLWVTPRPPGSNGQAYPGTCEMGPLQMQLS